MSLLDTILEGLVPDTISNIFDTELPKATAPDITFKPFTVTGPSGTTTTTADGSTTYDLSAQQEAMRQQLFGGASSFYGQALSPLSYGTPGAAAMTQGQQMLGQTPYGLGGVKSASGQAFGLGSQFMDQLGTSTADRESAIYDRIRSTQRPEEERQRMALEERLLSQGRSGIKTNQYGGTPEQLAMAKAQSESQNTAMLSAMQQAQAEQAQVAGLASQYAGLGSSLAGQSQAMTSAQQAQALQALQGGQALNMAEMQQALAQQAQQAQLGGQFLQQSYAPQASLLSSLAPALDVASMADVARRQKGEFDLEAQLANINASLGQQSGEASLYGGIYGGLLSGIGGLLGTSSQNAPWWTGLIPGVE